MAAAILQYGWRLVDPNNALVRQITLESNDIDQVSFEKEHPDKVAKGMRRFSMDTYSASKAGPNGTATQTQGLIGFMDGQPSYDDAKARMLKVAGDDAPSAATRGGVLAPKSNETIRPKIGSAEDENGGLTNPSSRVRA